MEMPYLRCRDPVCPGPSPSQILLSLSSLTARPSLTRHPTFGKCPSNASTCPETPVHAAIPPPCRDLQKKDFAGGGRGPRVSPRSLTSERNDFVTEALRSGSMCSQAGFNAGSMAKREPGGRGAVNERLELPPCGESTNEKPATKLGRAQWSADTTA